MHPESPFVPLVIAQAAHAELAERDESISLIQWRRLGLGLYAAVAARRFYSRTGNDRYLALVYTETWDGDTKTAQLVHETAGDRLDVLLDR